jgi:sarcosine oxidase, subunit beta
MTAATATADVVVIGGGVIGSSVALELRRNGYQVIVVDRFGAPGHGSTSASSAIVRFNYSTAAGVATAWEAKHCWDAWADHLGEASRSGLARLHRTGMVMVDTAGPDEPTCRRLETAGVPYEAWSPAEWARRMPCVDTGRFGPPKRVDDEAFWAEPSGRLGVLFMPDAGFVDDPQLATINLAEAARRDGARFVFHRRVTDIVTKARRVAAVVLDGGERLDAPIVVNAAGPWSTHVNRLAGVGCDFTVAVRPMRQEVHHVAAPPGYNADDGRLGPVIADLDVGVYVRPTLDGGLLVGGTEPECDELQWLDDPDGADPHPTAALFAVQVTRAARRLPGLRVPGTPRGVAGVYDVADDWAPIYDKTGLDGYYVAMGTSGNQFKNAPVVGRLMAALVGGVENGHDHDTQPIRYVGEHTGLTIDLAAFSRRRSTDNSGARSVMG